MSAKTNKKQLYAVRKTPKQARARATVQAVLDAGARVLIDHGYAGANTNLIAETAGVSIGSLYEYFPGKEAIFAELRRREGQKTYAELMTEPRPETPSAVLDHLVTTYINRFRDHHQLLVALENEVPRYAIAEVEQAVNDEYFPISDAFLSAHRNELRPQSTVPFVSEFLVRVVCSTVIDYAKYAPDRLSDPELTETVIDMLKRWLLKD